jgi:hypothetical protein
VVAVEHLEDERFAGLLEAAPDAMVATLLAKLDEILTTHN